MATQSMKMHIDRGIENGFVSVTEPGGSVSSIVVHWIDDEPTRDQVYRTIEQAQALILDDKIVLAASFNQ